MPFATDLTANAEDRLLMEAAAARQALGRPLVMPPGVPADRLVAMRKALVDTFDDPAFLADAKKNRMELTAPQRAGGAGPDRSGFGDSSPRG